MSRTVAAPSEAVVECRKSRTRGGAFPLPRKSATVGRTRWTDCRPYAIRSLGIKVTEGWGDEFRKPTVLEVPEYLRGGRSILFQVWKPVSTPLGIRSTGPRRLPGLRIRAGLVQH